MPHKKSIVHEGGDIAFIALYGLLITFCILFYNWANFTILLYLGWIILMSGIAFLLWSSQSRKKGSVSGEKSVNKEILVESGMYAYVRHAEFLSHILIILALILIAQNLASLLVGVILIVFLCLAIKEEEKRDIEKFSTAYEEYIKRVPRLNFLSGFIRQIRRKKEKEMNI